MDKNLILEKNEKFTKNSKNCVLEFKKELDNIKLTNNEKSMILGHFDR